MVGFLPSAQEGPSEKALCRLWQQRWAGEGGLHTRCGQPVRVLYQGLPNGDRGPDFHGAVVAFGSGGLARGDVELHLRSSQWRAHGHQADPSYNQVILHVVLLDDDPFPTLRCDGGLVPVLALGQAAGSGHFQGQRGRPGLCSGPVAAAEVGRILDEAGQSRFLAKAALLEGELAAVGPEEVLYRSLAAALGYAKNKDPFRRLAAALPLAHLEGFLWGKEAASQEAIAQALLIGRAGLLPSQRGLAVDGYWTACLEDTWRAYGMQPELALEDWDLGVRAENYPPRRLAGLAGLIVSALEEGLVVRLLAPLHREAKSQEEALVVRAAGYWREHFDVGRRGRLSPSLIGRGRAREMLANVVFPFAYALGQTWEDADLAEAALDAYRRLPRLEGNQVTRRMEEQLAVAPGLVNSAQRQQGLLHLFQAYCSQGKCQECSVGRPAPIVP